MVHAVITPQEPCALVTSMQDVRDKPVLSACPEEF